MVERPEPAPDETGAGRPPDAALPEASLTALRAPAVRRLLALRQEGALTTRQVQLAAECLSVTERTVWRWLAAAEQDPAAAREPGSRAQSSIRFTVTPEVRHLLALWKGNVAAVHRELTVRAGRQDPPGRVPSLPTLHRAIQRDLTAGERAGLAAGERAARKHDVFLTRPRGHRNQAWETDHMQAPVLVIVDTDAQPRRPWITWFVDCATNAIAGLAITPGHPSRESVLAALRSAVVRTAPYGPVGGLPQKVRVDRGKDFLSRTVTAAFGALGVEVEPLPAYTPHLKGTVEGLNRSVERMHLAALPGYVHQPRPGRRPGPADRSPLLSFEEFTTGLLAWAEWWNTEHRPAPLGGKTPLQAWQDDPTPVREIPQADLWSFTLEDDRARPRAVTTRGVKFKGRYYIAPWMTGRTGTRVSVRYMPHHDHEIELFDPVSGRHLGSAYLADQATPEQISAVRTARQARSRQLRKDLEASRDRERYAAATVPGPPRTLAALTAAEADHELAAADRTDLAALALPDLLPLAAPPPGLPVPASVAARLATAAPQSAEPRLVDPAPGPVPGLDHLPAEEES